jgi:hypothetical protein
VGEGSKPTVPRAIRALRSTRQREAARKRVEKSHEARGDVVAYVVINLFLIGTLGRDRVRLLLAPDEVPAGWGVLLLLNAWNVYHRRPITEEEIAKELRARSRMTHW